jgi:3D (Asp-Asp-Asp) domain-containing protein
MGIVAADNSVLPLGTRIRVTLAGIYSGIYTVRDTGAKVQGRHIDIFIANRAAAKQFGKKMVRIHVLHWGDGKPVVPAARATGA